jgi:HlyD family secretion protein
MDIPRPNAQRERRRRRIITAVIGLVLIGTVTVGLSRLKPAAPTVEKGSIYTDTVKRGEMLRQVRGNGSLLPEEINWIPVTTPGRVERILVLPGAVVEPETVMVELSNPEVAHAAFEAEWQLKAAEAQTTKLRTQLESERLSQEAAAAALNSDSSVAQLDAAADAELAKDGLVDRITARRSSTRAEQLVLRCKMEQERLRILADSHKAQLAAQDAELARLKAMLDLRRKQQAELRVCAGIKGVLQKLGDRDQLQVGQQFAAGANLARVANPARLKAEIKIVETQAKDVTHGQKAFIDTRNGIIPGHVVRIDPAVQNGTVSVDVVLDGPLPKGARPDLSVEGTIELERLENVMYVGRPVNGQSEGQVGLFKLQPGGKEANRVPVKLGRSSVTTIEVLGGLNVGDTVIISDMTAYDTHDRVRIN